MKKLIITLILILMVVFVLPTPASAAANAGVKPGSFFYFFDTTFEKLGLFFTFNPEKKAKKALDYAGERLAEIEVIAGGKNPNVIKTAIANYESNVALATEKSKEIKDKEQAEKLLTSIADNTSKHQEILADVLSKVPDEAKEAIMKAIGTGFNFNPQSILIDGDFASPAVNVSLAERDIVYRVCSLSLSHLHIAALAVETDAAFTVTVSGLNTRGAPPMTV